MDCWWLHEEWRYRSSRADFARADAGIASLEVAEVRTERTGFRIGEGMSGSG